MVLFVLGEVFGVWVMDVFVMGGLVKKVLIDCVVVDGSFVVWCGSYCCLLKIGGRLWGVVNRLCSVDGRG